MNVTIVSFLCKKLPFSVKVTVWNKSVWWLELFRLVKKWKTWSCLTFSATTQAHQFQFLHHFWVKKRIVSFCTQTEKVPSSKTPALTKSSNMGVWVVDTSNQLFMRGSWTETKFSKNKVVTGKTPFFVIVPFCTDHTICLNIGFW